MKNKKIILIAGMLMLLLGNYTNAQDISFEWAIQNGGKNADGAEEIKVDDLGNVYITGIFEGTVDFDPGPGIFNLSSGLSADNFIQKLDTDGNLDRGLLAGRNLHGGGHGPRSWHSDRQDERDVRGHEDRQGRRQGGRRWIARVGPALALV